MVSSITVLATIMACFAVTIMASPTGTSLAPLATPTVDNNYNHCWKNPKNIITDPRSPQACSSNVWTETAYTSGVENFNFLLKTAGGLPGVNTTTFLNTAGPEHCCDYCDVTADCLGWMMNSDEDCSCQIWTSNIPCNGTTVDLKGAFGVSGPPVSNTTSSYHVWLGNGNCNK